MSSNLKCSRKKSQSLSELGYRCITLKESRGAQVHKLNTQVEMEVLKSNYTITL